MTAPVSPPHSSAFAPLRNDCFLRACRRQATDYTPVWLMRQAGRYLPEYKATRAKAGSFMGLATNVDYATEVTLQPLERFALDAAILFSDILTVPDAMGLGLSFAEGEGPRFAQAVRDEADVARLAVPDLDKLRYVFDAVTSIRRALQGRVPLIGFSGSPWTLACYMVEGKGSSDYRLVKTLLYSRPDLMHRILAVNADAVAAYLNAQIDAGAQAVMVFDSWGGVLADGAFQQFSLAYTARVLAQLQRTGADGQDVPRIVFTKGGTQWLEDMRALDCEVLGLDWTAHLGKARALVGGAVGGPGKALQGNLDPNVLFAPPAQIEQQVQQALASFGPPHCERSTCGPTHIFNLGHGISQFTPPEHVAVLVEAVHSYSRTQRQAQTFSQLATP
ncbi:uroporphyrinogen decarboxylase [Extensimonas vulgaris]|uniref:Uroporphyrinogen decarboxylase n=1 Tax=Extensimonas vulgaris TaxID=1031594 RepID=A0A369AIP5_9BURK|nr:uroporphyrinogen decarboxylase [Extensimonas vulgaris]RCX09259.1 uroporphyrinogen decarboxylase [Extensimonas vulgaris]TWI37842.1 uroporphyrinogen decarboxylase [Extensimonas vulgaris]TXD15849.1 uroporphyrinogen decarboxylase [Extensimonas vulgaris]